MSIPKLTSQKIMASIIILVKYDLHVHKIPFQFVDALLEHFELNTFITPKINLILVLKLSNDGP